MPLTLDWPSRGYAGFYNCVVNILTMIVLHNFWPHSILKQKNKVLLGAQIFWFFSGYITVDIISGASPHLQRKHYMMVLMKNVKNNAKYMLK